VCGSSPGAIASACGTPFVSARYQSTYSSEKPKRGSRGMAIESFAGTAGEVLDVDLHAFDLD
jgi:hypothetical protein